MSDTSRVDPELAAFFRDVGQEFANYPPVRMEVPYEPHRRTLDTIALKAISGGPVMTETSDRWVTARGRRILCRLYRPRVDERPPVMVHFHGGGWIQSSIDTHDRLAREYAAAGDVAVVSVDYSLSPEAKFPQALEESAAVVRHLAANKSEWCVNGSRILLGGDSVGGNLALTVALLLRDTGGPPIKGILASYPVCEFTARHTQLPVLRRGWVWPNAGADEVRLGPLCSSWDRSTAPAGGAVASRPEGPAARTSRVAGDGCSAFGRRRYGDKATCGRSSGSN